MSCMPNMPIDTTVNCMYIPSVVTGQMLHYDIQDSSFDESRGDYDLS